GGGARELVNLDELLRPVRASLQRLDEQLARVVVAHLVDRLARLREARVVRARDPRHREHEQDEDTNHHASVPELNTLPGWIVIVSCLLLPSARTARTRCLPAGSSTLNSGVSPYD